MTFISQVVDNLNNNSDLQLSFENVKLELDQDAIYYYYYDMLVYLSYIQQQVYYDNNLLEQMKKLKLYADKGTSLSEILNNPLPVNEDNEDMVIEGCDLNVSYNLSGMNYVNELMDTLNAMKEEVLKTDQEMQQDYNLQPLEQEQEEELSSDKMELESDENVVDNDEVMIDNNEVELNAQEQEPMKEENPITPADQIMTEVKKRSSSSSIDTPAFKKQKFVGGKNTHGKTKKRYVARKNKKTKRSLVNRKRSIKKKASRRKYKKTVKRRK